MAYLDDRLYTAKSPDWDALTLPRESMAAHLFAHAPGWTQTIVYQATTRGCRRRCATTTARVGVDAVAVAPLVLGGRNLGWIGLSVAARRQCESQWRVALLEAIARQATLALHQSRLADAAGVEERRKAILEERNRLARDIHDNLAQGFAAILMQLQAAQRESAELPRRRSRRASRPPSNSRART